jgi:hypothetical protein
LWLLLGVAGVTLPMLVSHYVEMPMQRSTRRWLQARLDSASPFFKPKGSTA